MKRERRQYRVRPLLPSDLPACTWVGSPYHLQVVFDMLQQGDLFLAAVGRDERPVSLGAMDPAQSPGQGWLHMLVTDPAVRRRGAGTLLIGALEELARKHGARVVELAVEEENVLARNLYERLGYSPIGKEEHSWLQPTKGDHFEEYHAYCTRMRKQLY